MGNKILENNTQNEQIQLFYKRFSVLQRDPMNSVTFVEEKRTGKEFMLRQLTTNDQIQKRKIQNLVKEKQLHRNKYVIRLQDHLFEKDKSYCSNLFRAYLLFQTKFKDLRDEMIQRRISKNHFQDEEVLSVLQSGAMGIKYLREIGHQHQAISSSNILINKEGFILLSDPWLSAHQINMHVYDSPEKIKSISSTMEEHYDVYLSDLFSLGVVILEIYHLEFMDDVYNKNGRMINRELLERRLNTITNSKLRRYTGLLLDPQPEKRWSAIEEIDVVLRLYQKPRGYQPTMIEMRTPRPITREQKIIDAINHQNIQQTAKKHGSLMKQSHSVPDLNQIKFLNQYTSPIKIRQPVPMNPPSLTARHNKTLHVVQNPKVPVMTHRKLHGSSVSSTNSLNKKVNVEPLLSTKPQIRFNYVSQSGLVSTQSNTVSHNNPLQSKQTFQTLNLSTNGGLMNFSKSKNRSLTNYMTMRDGNAASTSTNASSSMYSSKPYVSHNRVNSSVTPMSTNTPSLNSSLPLNGQYNSPSFIKKVPKPVYQSVQKVQSNSVVQSVPTSSVTQSTKTASSIHASNGHNTKLHTPNTYTPLQYTPSLPTLHARNISSNLQTSTNIQSSSNRLQNFLHYNSPDSQLFTKPELLKDLATFSPRQPKDYNTPQQPQRRMKTQVSQADRYQLIQKYIDMEPKMLYDQYEANIVNSRSAINHLYKSQQETYTTQYQSTQIKPPSYTPSYPYEISLPTKTAYSVQSDRTYQTYYNYDRNYKADEPTQVKTPQESEKKVEPQETKVVQYVPEHSPREQHKQPQEVAKEPQESDHKYLLSYDMEANDSKNIKSSITQKQQLNSSNSLINAINMVEQSAPTTAQKVPQTLPVISEQPESETSTPARTRQMNKYNSTIAEVSESQNSADNEEQLQFFMEEYQGGSRYEGYKKNGMRNGKGKFYYQDGGYYEGQWKDNKMHGFGKLYYNEDKLAYEGQWYLDQFHGHGKVYNDNPVKLEGTFNYLNFDEMGQYWVYYEGSLVTDTKQGFGRLKFSNNQLFQGQFRHDRIEGKGRFYRSSGQIINGLWKDNKLVKVFD